MLEFITANNELIATITVTFAGLFAFIKWIDSRNREIENSKYNKYMGLISVIAGTRLDGQRAKLTEQIAAIWFLLEYDEYKHITQKIFSGTNLENEGNDVWAKHIAPQIKLMIKELND